MLLAGVVLLQRRRRRVARHGRSAVRGRRGVRRATSSRDGARDFNLMVRRDAVRRARVTADGASGSPRWPVRRLLCGARGGRCLMMRRADRRIAGTTLVVDGRGRRVDARESDRRRARGDRRHDRRAGQGRWDAKRMRAVELLRSGWARDVAVAIRRRRPSSVARASPPRGAGPPGASRPGDAEPASHAFQRAVARRTGPRGASEDSFWTRQAMYAFLERLDPTSSRRSRRNSLSRWRRPATAGRRVPLRAPRSRRPSLRGPPRWPCAILAGAFRAACPLTLLPVYYAHGGSARTPIPAQRRFGMMSTDEITRRSSKSLAPTRARSRRCWASRRTACAPSTPAELGRVLAAARRRARRCTSTRRSRRAFGRQYVAWSGRPGRWLLSIRASTRWCVVHDAHGRAGSAGSRRQRRRRARPTTGRISATGPSGRRVRGGGRALGRGQRLERDRRSVRQLRQLEYSQRSSSGAGAT